MEPAAISTLNVMQRPIGDMKQVAQVIAISRLFFARNDLRIVAAWIYKPRNAFEVRWVRGRPTRIGVLGALIVMPACLPLAHSRS